MSAETVDISDWDRFTRWFRCGLGKPSFKHVGLVIFLEYFAWGLLTLPMFIILNESFPNHTLLMNSLIVGIKGFLSFLGAPIIGVLSDKLGRKMFLLLSVFSTCAPIPLIQFNTWLFYGAISISGIFAVTLSITFAYIIDITPDEKERLVRFGRISSIFAVAEASSTALGAYLEMAYDRAVVVGIAITIAVLDVLFILFVVPESLSRKLEMSPYTAFEEVWQDKNIKILLLTFILSYLPEEGQHSCLFIYLRMALGLGPAVLALALVGIWSFAVETIGIKLIKKCLRIKIITLLGLFTLMANLLLFGFSTNIWIIGFAVLLLAWSSVIYPSISVLASIHADSDKQGLAQGIVTGGRGLCAGLGSLFYGLIFYAFQVELNGLNLQDRIAVKNWNLSDQSVDFDNRTVLLNVPQSHQESLFADIIPGPPFAFGALLVLLAIKVFLSIPEHRSLQHQDNYSNETEMENQPQHRQNTRPLEALVPNSMDVNT